MDLYIVGAVVLIVIAILAFLFYRYINAIESAVSKLHSEMAETRENLRNQPREEEHHHNNRTDAQEGGANLTEENINALNERLHRPQSSVAQYDLGDADDTTDDDAEEGDDDAAEDEDIPGLDELDGIQLSADDNEENSNMGGEANTFADLGDNTQQEPIELTEESLRGMKVNKLKEIAKEIGIVGYSSLKKVQLREAIIQKLSRNHEPENEPENDTMEVNTGDNIEDTGEDNSPEDNNMEDDGEMNIPEFESDMVDDNYPDTGNDDSTGDVIVINGPADDLSLEELDMIE
jgi:hypothetical protein